MKHLTIIPVLALAAAALLTGSIQLNAAESEGAERPLLRAQSYPATERGQQLQRGQRQRLQQCEVPCCENRQLRREAMRSRRGDAATRNPERQSRGNGRGRAD